ncbi:MAG: hypothetical protein HAW66_02325 [Shewanella sp.]|nr:hypothetical protein [Shewanella sp.]
MSTPANSIASSPTARSQITHWTSNTDVDNKHVGPHSEKTLTFTGNQVKYSVAGSDSKSRSVTKFIVCHKQDKAGNFNFDLFQKVNPNEISKILEQLPPHIVKGIKTKNEKFKTRTLVAERTITAIEAERSELSTEMSLKPMTGGGKFTTFTSHEGRLVFEIKKSEGSPDKVLFMNEIKEEIAVSVLKLGEKKILEEYPVTVQIEEGKYTIKVTSEDSQLCIQLTRTDAPLESSH